MTRSLRKLIRPTLPSAFILGAMCGAGIVGIVVYWLGETAEQADVRAAREYCAISIGSPNLLPDCVKSAVAAIQFKRRMQ
jgi:hypothetical protein